MRVLVLEDERPALEQLLGALQLWSEDAEVVGILDSVRSAVRWFQTHPEPDVVLADVRLTDGRSMEVFDQIAVGCPIVFVTAHDEYTQQALAAGGIDYVLKPVQAGRLAKALDKVLRLEEHFGSASRSGRRRLMVRRGSEVIAVPIAEVAWFNTEHRLVFAVCWDGRRHVVDKTLTVLQEELDPLRFLRINRSWVVCIDAVRGFRTHGKGRLQLSMEEPGGAQPVVSAEVASAFRQWIDR